MNPWTTQSDTSQTAQDNPWASSDTGGNNPWKTDTSDITKANKLLNSQDDNGYCQRFVEKVTTGKTGIFPSAIDAFNTYSRQGKARTDLNNLNAGDIVYFSANPGNQESGHTGIYLGKNKFISATYSGVGINDMTDWQNRTGQSILGYVSPRTTLPAIQ